MSWLAFKKNRRIARIPPRSEPAEDVLVRDEEGLPVADEECPRRRIYTEESDASDS